MMTSGSSSAASSTAARAVACLAYDGDVVYRAEHGLQPLAHQRVIVDEQDRSRPVASHDAAVVGSGKHARTVPPSAVGPAVRVAPTSAARSRIASMPTPAVHGPAPAPSSQTSTTSCAPLSASSRTRHVRAPEWRTTLLIASTAIRKVATSTAAGRSGGGSASRVIWTAVPSVRRWTCAAIAPARPRSSSDDGRRP